MKRILYFFPLNPADNNTGSCRRALALLKYFQNRHIQVDFVSQEDWGKWTEQSKEKFLSLGYTRQLFVLQRKPQKHNPITYFFTYKLWHWLYNLKIGKIETSFPNHTTLHLRKQFNAILKQHKYDAIIISYAYWAHLITDNDLTKSIPTIIDTHDFLTAQHVADDGLQPGIAFGDEMKRLNFFDSVWAISPEEHYLYTQMLGNKVDYIPTGMDLPKSTFKKNDFDIIYVATDNPHNIAGATWFFSEVAPLLSEKINILVIGTIVPFLKEYSSYFTGIAYQENLELFYQRSRIAICPMFTGTGQKIKVMEALAFQLPVVCTTRGLDGMPIRINNGCLVADEPATFAKHISHLLNDEKYYDQVSQLAHTTFQSCFTTAIAFQYLDQSLKKSGIS